MYVHTHMYGDTLTSTGFNMLFTKPRTNVFLSPPPPPCPNPPHLPLCSLALSLSCPSLELQARKEHLHFLHRRLQELLLLPLPFFLSRGVGGTRNSKRDKKWVVYSFLQVGTNIHKPTQDWARSPRTVNTVEEEKEEDVSLVRGLSGASFVSASVPT